MATIAAVATPPGTGGIAIIRISGPGSRAALEALFQPSNKNFGGFQPWKLHRGRFAGKDGATLDEGLAVFMPGPATFTGEDVVELHCHGGALLVERLLERVFELGARAAERGEFTRRAFLNGRIDLTQAEAVAELVVARSPTALRYGLGSLAGHLAERVRALKADLDDLRALVCIGLDFPDDEIEGLDPEAFAARLAPVLANINELLAHAERAQVFRQSNRIALVGPVNAGKSSLLNALAGRRRALVSASPGTTRDYLELELDFDGLPVCLIDTAGLRPDSAKPDEVEAAGISKSWEMLAGADLVWLVLDSASPPPLENLLGRIGREVPGKPLILVWNKTDLASPGRHPNYPQCDVSAMTGHNLQGLIAASKELIGQGADAADAGVAPNLRQAALLAEAERELRGLEDDLAAGAAYELCAARLDMAALKLDEILGLKAHDELLDSVFSRFCIGK